jgi:hypothetical protein
MPGRPYRPYIPYRPYRGRPAFTPIDINGLQLWLKADTGVIGGGAGQFTAANSEYLSIADNASLSTGDIDFTVAGWVYLDSLGTRGDIISRFLTSPGPVGEYTLVYVSNGSQYRFRFRTYYGPSILLGNVFADSLGVPSISTWYFIVIWQNAAAKTINIQVNDGSVDSASYSGGVISDTNSQFQIGATEGANSFNGRIDQVGFWKRVLTSGERTALYNAGAGKSYGDLTTAEKVSLVSYWELDEASGTRNDSHGTNHLTDNNTVTLANGVSNGTISDGDPVGQWTDLSGQNNHATQATASKKPIWKVNIINGKAVVRFDGTNDFLQNLTLTKAQPVSIFFVLNNRVYVSEDRIMDGSVGNSVILSTYINSPEMSIHAGTAYVATNSNLPVATFGVVYVLLNGASSEIRINGGAATTGNPGVNSFFNGITLGAAVAGTTAAAIDIAEVVIYGAALSANDRLKVETYLNDKYAIY